MSRKYILAAAACAAVIAPVAFAQPPAAQAGSGNRTHPAGEIAANVPLMARPYGVAISSEGMVYAALLDTNVIVRTTLPDTVFTSGPTAGVLPSHVVFDPTGARAYVANQGSSDISVLNVASNEQIATIRLSGSAWNVLVSRDGARLYATTGEGDLFVINTADNSIVATRTLMRMDPIRGMALSPDGGKLYLAGRNSGNVYEIDTGTNALSRVIPVGGMPQRIVVSPDGTRLYVANERWGIDFVNLADGSIKAHNMGAGGYGLALSPDGAELYLSIPDAAVVRVIDPQSGEVRKTLSVGGRPRVVAFAPDGRNAVIANEWGWVTIVK